MFDLKGKVAVVTGASAGIGVQLAQALAGQGADIAILARREELLKKHAENIRETGVNCVPVICDVTDTESVNNAAMKIEETYGKIDILVNNAGGGKGRPAEEMTDELWDYTINLSLNSVFKCCRAFGNIMLKNGYGRIINIASMYGLVGNFKIPSSAYHAAKGGVINYTRALAAEWGGRGVTVNAVCPGFFPSEATGRLFGQEFFSQYMRDFVPMHRAGKDGELNAAIAFLAADEASFVNGAVFAVDGGLTCI